MRANWDLNLDRFFYYIFDLLHVCFILIVLLILLHVKCDFIDAVSVLLQHLAGIRLDLGLDHFKQLFDLLFTVVLRDVLGFPLEGGDAELLGTLKSTIDFLFPGLDMVGDQCKYTLFCFRTTEYFQGLIQSGHHLILKT